MSADAERQLRDQIGTALDQYTPGPVPFDTIVRRGRAAVVRKRIANAVGAIVIVALAAGTPLILRSFTGPAPATRPPATHYRVSVSPPAPGAPQGEIATGTVNGWRWQVRASNGPSGQICFIGRGISGLCDDSQDLAQEHSGPPVSFFGVNGSPNPGSIVVGTVRADVNLVRVSLTNGSTLSLHPVQALGRRTAPLLALGVPDPQAVTRITAYSSRGEIGYAIPFTGAGAVETVRWLRPGQPALPRPATYTVGSGSTRGHAWTVRLAIGPWGTCGNVYMARTSTGECWTGDLKALRPGQLVSYTGVNAVLIQPSTGVFADQVAPAVSYVILTQRDGSIFRVSTRPAAGHRYFAYVSAYSPGGKTAPGFAVVRWTAYDAAGRKLGSGSL
jgi:hypothetical protein